MRRQSYQNGCVYQDKRLKRGGLWYFRWRDADGRHRSIALGECPNKIAAMKRAAKELPEINVGRKPRDGVITLGELATRYITEKLPTRFSTRRAYLNYIEKYIVKKWGTTRLPNIKPWEVDDWLQSLALSQKTKAHIKGLMHLLFEHAMLWEHLPNQPNPMRLITVKGQARSRRKRVNLSPEQFDALRSNMIAEPFRTMALTALALGLRFSELTGLKWGDVNWMESTVHIQRGVVLGVVDETKTAHSNVELPVASEVLEMWKSWRVMTGFKHDQDWMFASPYRAGKTPYAYSHLLRSLKSAAAKAGIPAISWHAFRHSYRTWMDEVGASAATMQKLMRHADYRTTMNVYGDVLDETMRKANSKVVGLVFRKIVPRSS